MKRLLLSIKRAYQRVVRGYDERIFWGFAGYFDAFVEPLEQFCSNYLKDTERTRLNPERTAIYIETLRRIEAYRAESVGEPGEQSNLWSYVGEHIEWYWY